MKIRKSWTFARPRRSLSEAARLGLLAAGLGASMLLAGLAARALPHRALPEPPRCYWIGPPLTHYNPVLLHRGLLDCAFQRCQFTLRQTGDAAWVCFFQRPWG